VFLSAHHPPLSIPTHLARRLSTPLLTPFNSTPISSLVWTLDPQFSPLVAHKAACASREASYEPSVNANGDADGKPSGEVIFHNYLGIGVDAAAALRFSRLRDHSPFLFVSALTNKLLYGVLGAEDVLTRSCGDLHRKVGRLVPIQYDPVGVVNAVP
jgi:hypothetical protein|tara:strand:+ start:460 stop:930 length:471 start_codon:yes stop_codon:yes gene_type:complete